MTNCMIYFDLTYVIDWTKWNWEFSEVSGGGQIRVAHKDQPIFSKWSDVCNYFTTLHIHGEHQMYEIAGDPKMANTNLMRNANRASE